MQREKTLFFFCLFLVMGFSCLCWISNAQAVVYEDMRIDPSDGSDGNLFGYSLNYNGSMIAVGARETDGTGAAYLFDAATGSQIKRLHPTGEAAGDRVGSAIAISGDFAFVGGMNADIGADADAGAVWIFQKDAGGTNNWGQIAKLTADTPVAGAGFGSAIAVDGNTMLICSQSEDIGSATKAGAAYIFQNDGFGSWTQTQRIEASDYAASDRFGQSGGISGDTLAIGAHVANKAYVFQNVEGTWTEQKILEVEGTTRMGTGTTIQGDTVVVGAYWETIDETAKAGTAYVFGRDEGGEDNWGQVAKLLPSDGSQADGYFGIDTAIDGDQIVVGAYGQDGKGAAYVYGQSAGAWNETGKLVSSDGAAGDYIGYRVGLVDDTAVISAIKALDGSDAVGAVYTFATPVFGIPGDADGNNIVDETDAAIVAGNWGQPVPGGPSVGDFNNDGFVDATDASIMAANWGDHNISAGGGMVPEPSAIVLLLTGIFLLVVRSNRLHRG